MTEEFKSLARDLARESIVTHALQRLIEQIIGEIQENRVKPLQQAIVLAIHELNYHHPERALEVLKAQLRASVPDPAE